MEIIIVREFVISSPIPPRSNYVESCKDQNHKIYSITKSIHSAEFWNPSFQFGRVLWHILTALSMTPVMKNQCQSQKILEEKKMENYEENFSSDESFDETMTSKNKYDKAGGQQRYSPTNLSKLSDFFKTFEHHESFSMLCVDEVCERDIRVEKCASKNWNWNSYVRVQCCSSVYC